MANQGEPSRAVAPDQERAYHSMDAETQSAGNVLVLAAGQLTVQRAQGQEAGIRAAANMLELINLEDMDPMGG